MDQARSAEEKFPKKTSNPSALPLANSANFSSLSDIQKPSRIYSNPVFELEGHNFPIAFSGVPPLSTVGGETKRNGLP